MSGVLKQFLATITSTVLFQLILSNLLSAAYGSASTWAGPNFAILTGENAPFESGPLRKEQASLVVSMPCFGAIIGTVLYTMIIDRFSRKLLLISIAIPEIISWTILLVASNVYHVYAARLIIGIVGSGAFVVVPVFVSEIAEDKVRGSLGSMLILTTNAGALFGFAISLFLDYSGQIKINLVIPTLFLILYHFFPETPEYLLKNNQKNAAEKSLSFYRGIENTKTEEMTKMNEAEKTYEKIESEETSLSFSDFRTRAEKKAIFIALFLGALNQFCGAFTLVSYTNNIIRDAGSTLSPDSAAVIIGCVQLLANICTMLLVDRAGRKILVTISSLGSAIGLISMGLYDIFKDSLGDHRWIPVVAFSMVIFMGSVGMLPLTFVLLSEILPKKIKSTVTLCALEIIWMLAFIFVTLYPTLAEAIGSHNIEFGFAACCILGAAFYLTVLPETSGKSYDEIKRASEK